MLVCHCHAVNDRTIRDAIRRGACSVQEVGEACGAATGCGGCHAEVEGIVESEAGLVHIGLRRGDSLAQTG